ncbi:MAG: hypothetical protein HQ527_10745 [Cyanobacteria bacterium]|nr:hypothetical protein [Cyanobacteria bacterium bin.51]
MVSRRPRRRAAVELSLDCLIDVFMNVLGVLMITAMVIALSARGPGQSTAKEETAKEETPKPEPAPPPVVKSAPIRLLLPQLEESFTQPLYVLLTAEGLRPVNGSDLSELERYFLLEEMGTSLRMEPRPGQVMGRDAFQQWLRGFDPSNRHVTALIRPDGVRFYRDLREITAAAGFRSGWLDHQTNTVVLGSGGRSGSDVQ